MADDVTLRVGSTVSSRAGFINTIRDLGRVGDAADDTQRELQQLDRTVVQPAITAQTGQLLGDVEQIRAELRQVAAMDVEPEVRANAQQLLASLDQAEAALQRVDGMNAAATSTADVQAALGDLGRAEAALREIDGRRAEMAVSVNADQVDGEVRGMRGRLSSAGTALGQGIGQGIGAAITTAITTAISTAVEQETANARLTAQFSADPAAAEQAGRVAGRLWSQGYGESLEEVNNAVFNVVTSSAEMRSASEADIQAVTGSALNLANVWGLDVTQSMRAAGQLMNNDLVPNMESGLGLINAAYQTLGPAADDTLDTLVEYSTQFRALGLTGPQAMTMLNQAVQAGARDTDTAADAMKEFALIVAAGGDQVNEAYARVGLSGADMTAKIAAGGPAAAAALDLTLDKLRAIEDPVTRNATGVALFGTKWEDMQASLLAMDVTPVEDQFTNLEGTLARTNDAMNNTTENSIAQIGRNSTAVLTNIADQERAAEAGLGLAIGVFGVWNNLFGTHADVVEEQTGRAAQALSGNTARGVDSAAQSVGALPSRTAAALAGMYGQGSAAGTDLGRGFQAGINAQIAAVAGAARAAAQRAVAAIRGALRTGSPSKVTYGLGEDFGEGFDGGIDAWSDRIVASARGVGLDAAAALGGAVRPAAPGAAAGQLVGGPAPAGDAGGVRLELVFGGRTDSAFATAFMNLVRTGVIQIRPTS